MLFDFATNNSSEQIELCDITRNAMSNDTLPMPRLEIRMPRHTLSTPSFSNNQSCHASTNFNHQPSFPLQTQQSQSSTQTIQQTSQQTQSATPPSQLVSSSTIMPSLMSAPTVLPV